MYKTILVFSLSLCAVLAKNEIYDGHSLFEIDLQTEEQGLFLSGLVGRLNLDVWSHGGHGTPANVLVPKLARTALESGLDALGIGYKVTVENIKEELDLEEKLQSEAAARSSRTTSRLGLSFDTIHGYGVVDSYLVALANEYPNIVTVVSAGTSIEGRDIKYLKISSTNFEDRSKPVVFLESLLHGREWVTLPVTLYAIEKLVIDVQEQDLLQNIDWIILPIANPDGYERTHTIDRFWRKNLARGFVNEDLCAGVDLNRNFDFEWSQASSNYVCDETFHGRSAFSEPESAALRDIILEYVDRIELFVDFHCCASYILYGFGDGQLPPNGLTLHQNGVGMAQAIDAVKWPSNINYVVGNGGLVVGVESGRARDYAQASGIPLSYTIELPATNSSSGFLSWFLVDPDFIEQAGFETWQGIKAGARFALGNYRARYNKK